MIEILLLPLIYAVTSLLKVRPYTYSGMFTGSCLIDFLGRYRRYPWPRFWFLKKTRKVGPWLYFHMDWVEVVLRIGVGQPCSTTKRANWYPVNCVVGWLHLDVSCLQSNTEMALATCSATVGVKKHSTSRSQSLSTLSMMEA